MGMADCERLRRFVEMIIDECESSEHYSMIYAVLGALEDAVEMKTPPWASNDPRRRIMEKRNSPEEIERFNQMLRDAGQDHLIIDDE